MLRIRIEVTLLRCIHWRGALSISYCHTPNEYQSATHFELRFQLLMMTPNYFSWWYPISCALHAKLSFCHFWSSFIPISEALSLSFWPRHLQGVLHDSLLLIIRSFATDFRHTISRRCRCRRIDRFTKRHKFKYLLFIYFLWISSAMMKDSFWRAPAYALERCALKL